MTITVVGDGSQLSFQMMGGSLSKQLLCSLPFKLSGDTATLVAGSACVAGDGNICTPDGPVSLAIQTFLSGTATLDSSGTMTLETRDVLTIPQQRTPECGGTQDAEDQTSVESMTATLARN